MDEAIESFNGTDVGKETKLLTHGEETLFGAHLGGGIIIEFWVANSSEEDGIAIQAELMGLSRIRVTHGIDSMSAANAVFVMEFVAVLLADSFGDLESLGDDFRANAVARENC